MESLFGCLADSKGSKCYNFHTLLLFPDYCIFPLWAQAKAITRKRAHWPRHMWVSKLMRGRFPRCATYFQLEIREIAVMCLAHVWPHKVTQAENTFGGKSQGLGRVQLGNAWHWYGVGSRRSKSVVKSGSVEHSARRLRKARDSSCMHLPIKPQVYPSL